MKKAPAIFRPRARQKPQANDADRFILSSVAFLTEPANYEHIRRPEVRMPETKLWQWFLSVGEAGEEEKLYGHFHLSVVPRHLRQRTGKQGTGMSVKWGESIKQKPEGEKKSSRNLP